MKKIGKYILSLAVFFGAPSLYASPLTPVQALERVQKSAVRQLKAPTTQAPRLLSTFNGDSGMPAIYLYTFSGNEGFMLVAADDAVTPLIGYSETGSFGTNDMAPSVEAWVKQYVGQIEASRDCGPYRETATRAGDRAPVEPMLKTTWDQTSPYNNLCPAEGPYRTVTGCVATAMAQVMKYWQYPSVGQGSISYRPENVGTELTMDFSATKFDWDNMQNSYGKNYSATAARAVATLMKACGYSVKMKYGAAASGASMRDVPSALMTYFGYDKGVNRKGRDEYSSQEDWNDLIYNDMVNVGPVIYSGASASAGHCFVCDGYDGNGYFHINWGWGGLSDGYFLLNNLTPNDLGTGGGYYGGYNLSQEVVLGVMPPVGRLILENIAIDNCADDTGNVKGWGYTYRINNFSEMLLTLELKVAGGHLSSPLYVNIYDTDPDTKKLGDMVHESQFGNNLNLSDGTATYSTLVNFRNYDPSKLYTLNVSYNLKGQRTTIGSIRLAASSGVESVVGSNEGLLLKMAGDRAVTVECDEKATLSVYDMSGRLIKVERGFNPSLSLEGLPAGAYIARAQTESGATKSLKLLLK